MILPMCPVNIRLWNKMIAIRFSWLAQTGAYEIVLDLGSQHWKLRNNTWSETIEKNKHNFFLVVISWEPCEVTVWNIAWHFVTNTVGHSLRSKMVSQDADNSQKIHHKSSENWILGKKFPKVIRCWIPLTLRSWTKPDKTRESMRYSCLFLSCSPRRT